MDIKDLFVTGIVCIKPTTLNIIFCVNYYVALHNAISLHYLGDYLPSKVVNVL
jgi:hypothetical protein